MSAPAREVPNRCRDGTVLQNHQELIRSKAILGTDVLCQERGVVHFGVESRQNAGNLPESFFCREECRKVRGCYAKLQAKSGMGKTAVFVLACLQQARMAFSMRPTIACERR